MACSASGATTEGSLGGGKRTVTARPGHCEDGHRGGRRVDGAAISAAAAAEDGEIAIVGLRASLDGDVDSRGRLTERRGHGGCVKPGR